MVIGELKGTCKLPRFLEIGRGSTSATCHGNIHGRPSQPIRVLICGEPYSGNRMLNTIMGQLGCAATIMHGVGDLPRREGVEPHIYRKMRERFELFCPTHAIMPVRSIPCQQRSLFKHDRAGSIWRKGRDQPTWDVCRVVVDYRIPMKVVSYEAFIETPREHLIWLADWMGVEKRIVDNTDLSWLFDGNQKYRDNPLPEGVELTPSFFAREPEGVEV